MIERADVEALTGCLAGQEHRISVTWTLRTDLLAELCRVWLAVDSAPEATVIGECPDCGFHRVDGDTVADDDRIIAMRNQRVRPVPLATAKGGR